MSPANATRANPEADGGMEAEAALRGAYLAENHLLGTFRAHRRRVTGDLVPRYDAWILFATQRIARLESSLVRSGIRPPRGWARFRRVTGSLVGIVTALGGARRLLAVDADGVRRLEDSYASLGDGSPKRVFWMLTEFAAELEEERVALVRRARCAEEGTKRS